MEGKREKGKCENEEKKEGKETKRMEKERERDRQIGRASCRERV